MFALLTALLWLAVRTTPGLTRPATDPRELCPGPHRQGRRPMSTGRAWTRPRRTCPDWCTHRTITCPARDGRPGGEHRSAPIAVTVPGAGRVLLTRVRSADG